MYVHLFATCHDNKKVEHLLTVGKMYEVLDESLWLLLVQTDQGSQEWLGKDRFHYAVTEK